MRHKIDILVIRPSPSAAHTGNLIVGRLFQCSFIDMFVIEQMCQVDDDSRFLSSGECVAVHTGMGGCRQFHLYTFFFQHDGIISGGSLLFFMAESRRKTKRFGRQVRLLCSGAKQDVAQVNAAGAAKVGMRKSFQSAVVIVVPRTGIPVSGTRVGTQLHCPERHSRPRIGMSVEAGTDERVYAINRLFHIGRTSPTHYTDQNGIQKFFQIH